MPEEHELHTERAAALKPQQANDILYTGHI